MAKFTTFNEFMNLYFSLSKKGQDILVHELTDEQLRLTGGSRKTVAHLLAEYGGLPREKITRELLKMKTFAGVSVAHLLAKGGCFPGDLLTVEIMKIRDSNGSSVAHVLADNSILPEELMTEEILGLVNEFSETVTQILAVRDGFPHKLMTPEILKTRVGNGWTIANQLALYGRLPEDLLTDENLRMADKWGDTVAHYLGKGGHFPRELITRDILFMKNDNGKTVFEGVVDGICKENDSWQNLYPELLEIKAEFPVLSNITRRLSSMFEKELMDAVSKIPEESINIIYCETDDKVLKTVIDTLFDLKTKIAETQILKNAASQEDEFIPDFYFEGRNP